MKYFLIAGEASGDLHAAHLMEALQKVDEKADFCYFGGDCMAAVGGRLLVHYRDLAYMGFIPVLLHLPTILRGMSFCKKAIKTWQPDCVILVDYPGFNLKIARFVKAAAICPVYYYISPKIWAWKEHRIKDIRRDIAALFSILPFEVDFFTRRHNYPIHYVGNPTLDEVDTFIKVNKSSVSDGRTIALLPGSRRQEVVDNLSRMLKAVKPYLSDYKATIALAPALPRSLYENIIRRSGVDETRLVFVDGGRSDGTFKLLSHATAALVTSGTATLETALFRVPQVVCYFMRPPRLVSLLRPYFLKVPFISLVNLIAGREVVPELVGAEMNVSELQGRLGKILPGGNERNAQLEGYDEVTAKLGKPGAPHRAAALIVEMLKGRKFV